MVTWCGSGKEQEGGTVVWEGGTVVLEGGTVVWEGGTVVWEGGTVVWEVLGEWCGRCWVSGVGGAG